MAPGELLLEHRQASSTSLQGLQRSWPPPRTQSSDSIATTASQPIMSTTPSQPSLRKRHSNYMRVAERSTSPIPELPPQRPPRNPARSSTVAPAQSSPPRKPKSASRPSTATSTRDTREDITPWDFQPGPVFDEKPRLRSGAPSVKSKASSTGLGGASTGPVEEVTPWELYPVPTNPPVPKVPSAPPSAIFVPSPAAPPPRTLHPTTATGLVEDVTPWELGPTPGPSAGTTDIPQQTPIHRPKPASLLSNPSSKSHRVSTATGPTEEVTPWELQSQPTPEEPREKGSPQSNRNSLTMSKAQLEEVTPWELYPAPPVPALNGATFPAPLKSGTASSRQSASPKTLADFGIRRRRSTGSRPSKLRTSSQSNSTKAPSRVNSSQTMGSNQPYDNAQPSPLTPKSSFASSTPTQSDNAPGTPSAGPSKSDMRSKQQNPHFSTADRTILEELKRNIHARAAQFVQKGVGVHLTDGTVSLGKRHHPYHRKEVPYPRSYDREVIDLDVWETLFCQDICESLTWHVFEEPPLKVLDLGCGTGTWILNCARAWRESQFVGLDIVPLQPDLQRVGSNDYASRITWVQANFLEGLPFPNDEFDFVHIKRIALGVPEDKWDSLLDEIYRVMKPGGAFEMVEEDLFFPGKVNEREEEADLVSSPLSRSSSIASTTGRSSIYHSSTPLDSIPQQGESESNFASTPTVASAAFPNALSRPATPEPPDVDPVPPPAEANEVKSDARTTTPPGSPPGFITLIPPHSRSSARPTLYVRTNTSSAFSFPATSPPKSNNSSLFSNSAVSLLNSFTGPSDSDHQLFRRRRSSTNLTSGAEHVNGGVQPSQVQPSQPQKHSSTLSVDSHTNGISPGPSKSDPSKAPPPFLLRTPAKPPANPRDHSLLEYIYNETLSSRFINTSPLSMLTTYLEYHFKDARTHPPLVFAFPPVPPRQDIEPGSATEDEYDEQNKENSPTQPSPSRKSTSQTQRTAFNDESGELLEEHRWLSMRGLLDQSSPYISLDSSRNYAFTPAKKSNFSNNRSKEAKEGRARRQSRLPNKTLHIDLRTLNLHLAIRAKEVLACSESMWEWIQEAQRKWKREKEKEAQRRNGRGFSMESSHPYRSHSLYGNDTPDHKSTVKEMTREDFNQLLLNFEMDMQDQASLHSALKERFQWNVIDSAPPQNRKIFNTACEKYEKWLEKEARMSTSSSSARPSRNSLLGPSNISVTAPTPDTPVPHDVTKPKTRARSNSHTILLNGNGAERANGNVPQMPQRSDASVHFALPSNLPSALPPTQKLSRSVCVFVAWKPEDVPSAKT